MPAHTLRPPRPDDVETVVELVNAANAADGIPWLLTTEELRETLAAPHLDPAADVRVAVADGRTVGYALVHRRPSSVGEAWAFLEGAVHPQHRRGGIGRDLAGWQMARARELLDAAPADLPRLVRVDIHPAQTDKERLFVRWGLKPVRWFEDLLRPLDHLPEVAADGFEILGWDETRSQELRLLENAAFEDHWGSTPLDPLTWEHWLSRNQTRLDLSCMAVAGDEIVGYSINSHHPADEAVHGRRKGWIDSLGTRRDWRGRGVATALICRSLQAFAAAGFTHAALGVDTDNPTGAHHLYARLGFEPHLSVKLLQAEL